jgi:hypothetical protein
VRTALAPQHSALARRRSIVLPRSWTERPRLRPSTEALARRLPMTIFRPQRMLEARIELQERSSLRRSTTMGPYLFFVVATGIWIAFGWTLAIRPVLLDRAWGGVRRLPLLAKPIVWIAFLPWLSALAIWESGWRTPRARLISVVVVAFAFIVFWWSGTPAAGTSS